MSGQLYGVRPSAPRDTTGDLGVSSRVIHLDPGLFSLSLMPSPSPGATGLPGVRVSVPPNPPGRRETVSINTFRGDGWMTDGDEPTLLLVPSGGAEILLTSYWSATDPAASPPALKLMRLNPESAEATGCTPHNVKSPEIVAHIEGVGDVEGKLGDWVGTRGSGRSIEGFSLTPGSGIATDDFDIRAVLGRDWLSPWLPGGSFCGSRGLALPLRGFCVRLRPKALAHYELACFARFVDGSEVGPIGADRICAAPTLAALEGFQVQLLPRAG
jgi:hypothetical protein